MQHDVYYNNVMLWLDIINGNYAASTRFHMNFIILSNCPDKNAYKWNLESNYYQEYEYISFFAPESESNHPLGEMVTSPMVLMY